MEPIEAFLWDGEDSEDTTPSAEDTPIRDLLHIRTTLTCQRMIAELSTAPTAIRMGLPAFVAIQYGLEEMPEAVRDIMAASAEVVVEVLDEEEPQNG
jgi:hypothetical protein